MSDSINYRRTAGTCSAPKCWDGGPRCVQGFCRKCCELLHSELKNHLLPAEVGKYAPIKAFLYGQGKVA